MIIIKIYHLLPRHAKMNTIWQTCRSEECYVCVPGRVVGLYHQVSVNQSAHWRPGCVLTAQIRLHAKKKKKRKKKKKKRNSCCKNQVLNKLTVRSLISRINMSRDWLSVWCSNFLLQQWRTCHKGAELLFAAPFWTYNLCYLGSKERDENVLLMSQCRNISKWSEHWPGTVCKGWAAQHNPPTSSGARIPSSSSCPLLHHFLSLSLHLQLSSSTRKDWLHTGEVILVEATFFFIVKQFVTFVCERCYINNLTYLL